MFLRKIMSREELVQRQMEYQRLLSLPACREARAEFLREFAESHRCPGWMKQWLRQGITPPGYLVDHLRPLSWGGPNEPLNMRLLDIDMYNLHQDKWWRYDNG
ncbi:MAG: hypothetical protein WED00_18155 [Aquisalimonadaceae bacterium]